jgi:hypothetical protein
LPFFALPVNLFYTSFSFVLQAAAKYLWSMVGMAVGVQIRPGSFAQLFWWMPEHSFASRNVQIAGLAAI